MTLPQDFIEEIADLLSNDELGRFIQSMDEPCPVSIRMNNAVLSDVLEDGPSAQLITGGVPWCKEGLYLKERPSFTLDPLLHAGAYYVQEASSMFVAHIVRQFVTEPATALDLCAAPGGKSTLLLESLPMGSLLVANEVNHKRSNILAENICKWMRVGSKPCVVTNNEAKDFKKLGKNLFDLILCDVPCSGEGMFRKDERAIEEWSLENVEMCWKRQRDIVGEIWDSLKTDGLMIYSTCTYNTKEDEENVRWISEELGAEILDCKPMEEWNIMGNLLKDSDFPCYHFMPHRVRGEGFFCALLRKSSDEVSSLKRQSNLMADIKKQLRIVPLDEIDRNSPVCELSHSEAMNYLRGEALRLPSDTPRGKVVVTYQSLPLGMVNNIGNRANNLYPKEWRIRKRI